MKATLDLASDRYLKVALVGSSSDVRNMLPRAIVFNNVPPVDVYSLFLSDVER